MSGPTLPPDCENPYHERATRLALEGEFVGWELRGLAHLLTAWGSYLATSTPGARGHDEVTMFLTRAVDGMADRLSPEPAPSTPAPDADRPTLTVVRPETSA